jgi:hypothetical protein
VVSFILRHYRRLRYGQAIVVVSGLPRSGTSMIMKMLEAGGIPVIIDGIRTADEDNPKGYYEDERVKNLAQEQDKRWLEASQGKAIKIISYLLKELPATYNYDVLFIRRDLSEVLASQSKMLTRRGESSETSDEKMVELYENDLWKVNYLMKHAAHFRTLEIHYRQILENPRTEAERISAFLGGSLDPDKMAAVVDPALYRNRASRNGA